jgi:hypothetical protein
MARVVAATMRYACHGAMMLAVSATASWQIRLGRTQSRWDNVAPERHEQHEIGKESSHW